jgi:tRNA nucleotidyltransferase/poly(A) polymerase
MTASRDAARVFQVLLHHRAVRALVEAAGELGVEAHLVGGVLRDRFLGLPSRDLDAVVSERGRAVAERAAERLGARFVHLGGDAFGAYRLIGDPGPGAWVLDLWDREGASLEADLARRDFTVNAVALALPGAALVDPHDGLGDLRRRVLRATTPASFTGDPLRVLRLPRLLVQLPGFTPETETLALARASAPELATVASERVRDELSLLFTQPEVDRGVAVLGALDVYPGLWLGRPGEPAPEAQEIGHLCGELSRLGPAAQRLRELAGGTLPFPVDHRLARFALTFGHLPGDAPPGEALAAFTEAGYLTRRDTGGVARLLPWRRLPAEALEHRRFLHRLGELWPTAACHAGARSAAQGHTEAWEESAAALARIYRDEGDTILAPPQLLDGREAGELLGVPPGPEIGQALRELRWAQVEGRVRTREEARRFMERMRRGRAAGERS